MRIAALAVLVLAACPAPVSAPPTAPVADPLRCRPCPADAGVTIDSGAITVIDAGSPGDAPVDAVVAPPIPLPPPGTHPRIMLGSQGARLKASLSAGGTAATRWRAAIEKWYAGADLWGFDAWNGALLSQLTGDTKYCIKAVTLIDKQVSTAEIKIAAGAVPLVAGDSYLGIGELIGDLALVYDWCHPQTTAAQRARWIAYANQAVWNVWNHKVAIWGTRLAPWTGWSVDNPSNNYYYSFLRATMLLGLATKGENAAAEGWITKFRDEKILGQLIPQFERDHADGGSREGTGYGVALRGLWELYAFWQWSTGEDLGSRTAHTRASLPTFLHQVLPTLDRVAPTGDHSRDSTAMLFDYHRAYLLELAALYPADPVAARAVRLLADSSVTQMANGFMLSYDFVYAPTVAPAALDLPLVRYARGIGQIYARSSWQKSATWLNLTAGPYTESHAHHDQGSLMLFKGSWLVTDSVLWSKGGVAQSTSPVGTTAAHSLVRIDIDGKPLRQKYGSTSKVLALHTGPGYVFAAVDLTPAYAGTAVTLIRRQVLWLQPDVVIVHDRVVSSSATSQTWQLVVPVAPVVSGNSATVTTAGHTLRVTRVQPASGPWLVHDFRDDPDLTGGWRLDQVQPGGDRTYVTVLSIDGATSPAVSTVAFADVGCTFTLGGKQITLTTGIDPL
jgi:hypothetical protein